MTYCIEIKKFSTINDTKYDYDVIDHIVVLRVKSRSKTIESTIFRVHSLWDELLKLENRLKTSLDYPNSNKSATLHWLCS